MGPTDPLKHIEVVEEAIIMRRLFTQIFCFLLIAVAVMAFLKIWIITGDQRIEPIGNALHPRDPIRIQVFASINIVSHNIS